MQTEVDEFGAHGDAGNPGPARWHALRRALHDHLDQHRRAAGNLPVLPLAGYPLGMRSRLDELAKLA